MIRHDDGGVDAFLFGYSGILYSIPKKVNDE